MVYERKQQRLISRAAFAHRLAWHVAGALLLVLVPLAIGMAGCMTLEG